MDEPLSAGMAELADAADSKSADLRVLGVRLPLPAPNPNAIRVLNLFTFHAKRHGHDVRHRA